MDQATFYKLALLPNNFISVIAIILIGIYFINQQNFFYITVSTLFAIILNAYLKSIWQIPLNPELLKFGWSYPSTHTVFNAVFYAAILIFYRKIWVLILSLILLIAGFFAMVYFRYHIWLDIFGGICAAGLIILPLYYWIQFAFKAQLQFGILLSILSLVLLLLLPDLPLNYGWDWQVLGYIIGLTACNETIALKKYSKAMKLLNMCLLLPVVLVSSKIHMPNAFILNLLIGIVVSSTIFLALPCATGAKRLLAVVKK